MINTIKKLSLMCLLCTLFGTISASAQNADAIIGKWINPSGEGQIQIYKKGNLYYGKLAWIKAPNDEATGQPKTDKNNPDKKLRSRPLLGLELLKNFKFDGEDVYEDGNIYDPKNGKQYKCKMTLSGNQLTIRGFIGISLLGRSEVWSRVK
jgi:uncharacterized protein (DUF2147 family)